MKKIKKSGGERKGSGRKLIYGEKTEQLQISVPKSKKPVIKKMILDFLEPLKINSKK